MCALYSVTATVEIAITTEMLYVRTVSLTIDCGQNSTMSSLFFLYDLKKKNYFMMWNSRKVQVGLEPRVFSIFSVWKVEDVL